MKNILLILVFLYLAAVGYLYFKQDKLIFKREFAKPYTPAAGRVELIEFNTSDGLKLEGGFVNHGRKPLVLYFGGNAANILHFLEDTAYKIDEFNFIAFNYPGYGKSEGKPSQRAIFKYALEIAKKYKPKIIIGRSLGTAVASYVASKTEVDKLLLITPFDSIEHIAKIEYPYFPVSLLLKHKFKELEYLKKTKAKKIYALFVNSDEVIPKESIENLKKHIKFDKSQSIEATHDGIYQYPNIDRVIAKLLK